MLVPPFPEYLATAEGTRILKEDVLPCRKKGRQRTDKLNLGLCAVLKKNVAGWVVFHLGCDTIELLRDGDTSR